MRDETTSPQTLTGRVKSVALAISQRAEVVAQREWRATVAALLGALASVVVMLALRLTAGAPTLPELVGERILPDMPVGLFIQMLVTFAPHSKTGPLGLTLLGQILIGVALGPLYRRLARVPDQFAERVWPSRRALAVAGISALAMEIVGVILFWPVLGESLVGRPVSQAALVTALCMLLTFLTFAYGMLAADHLLRLPSGAAAVGQAEDAVSRRDAIHLAGGVALAAFAELAGLDALIGAYLARSNLGYEGLATPGGVESAITPVSDFYIVSKNVLDPIVDRGLWRLEIAGLVRSPRSWDLAGVRALPAETRAITLECISNVVGGRLMSTAEWRGVALQTVLDAAGGTPPSGRYVVFQSVDGYTSSLPLADLLKAQALLAYDMNGAPLPDRHGAPLRLVMPGRYGEQSAKWLTKIEVVDTPYQGFYQSQGWSSTPVSTTSRIDVPGGPVKPGAVPVSGIAYAGTRGIQKAEVSADGGLTWNAAALDPPLSDQTWVLWHWTWQPATPGTYTLVVRAVDGTGALQSSVDSSIVPAGATGLHQVKVRVDA
jgi:DMSO/TMAO reductase YedYZ molybdopterin-dependent catalytic subunit